MAEQWMSIVEYARTFKVSDMTVRRRIKTGRLHAVLKEGKYFIPTPVEGGRQSASTAAPAAQQSEPAPRQAESPRYPEARYDVESRYAEPRGRVQNDMVVIKGHPSAHKTYATTHQHASPPPAQHQHQQSHQAHLSHQQAPQTSAHRIDFGFEDDESSEMAVPGSLRRTLSSTETSLVDTRALLAFCEASLRKVNETERRQAEKFKSRIEALETTLGSKDLELKHLRQQVEDLQLLITVLDAKRKVG